MKRTQRKQNEPILVHLPKRLIKTLNRIAKQEAMSRAQLIRLTLQLHEGTDSALIITIAEGKQHAN